MKTALQTLIEWITDEVHPSQIKQQAELLLELEKGQIVSAYSNGINHNEESPDNSDMMYGDKMGDLYYRQNF